MKLEIGKKAGVEIAPGMIGLFFEDINYAADGGLYAEMIENRSFEFLEAEGDARDYFTHYDGGYAWKPYVESEKEGCEETGYGLTSGGETGRKAAVGEELRNEDSDEAVTMRLVMGSSLTAENPHYLRLITRRPMCGVANKAYDGVCLQKGMRYHITFWARCVHYEGAFAVRVIKGGSVYASGRIEASAGTEETYHFYRKYCLSITAQETITGGFFALCLEQPGTVEVDYVSMFPADAVAGIFRRDLFEKLQDLKPGFLRFPGGCVVEGDTFENRYRFKESLKEPWARRNNWNRWAVHGNREENQYRSVYSHYNQTLGLGYYEYFLLCELLGARPLPVLNVGLACQYQSAELVSVDSPQFQELLKDAVDLIAFANGGTDTVWGGVRAKMGHPEPFGLTMLGIGNEQWETDRVDFFKRYCLFEEAIHAYDPSVRLIGSAGPDITSERYQRAWEFYHAHENQENFVYAVDEHYYVPPQWLYQHVDFYDRYSREVKVFSGEYAAHPVSGMNRPDANTLEGALAEAAFLTGVERNADVVVLASYAPLFARVGYAQWSPDMIWFDGAQSYGTPSYYVQRMFARHMGDMTLDARGREKKAAREGIYYSLSYRKADRTILIKVVNSTDERKVLEIELAREWREDCAEWQANSTEYHMELLTSDQPGDYNCPEHPTRVVPVEGQGDLSEGIPLPARSFAVIEIGV